MIGNNDVGSARIMDAYGQYHRCWLWKAVDELIAYTDPHAVGAFRLFDSGHTNSGDREVHVIGSPRVKPPVESGDPQHLSPKRAVDKDRYVPTQCFCCG